MTGGSGKAGAAPPAGEAASGADGSSVTFPSGVVEPRIMIVGDSISAGPGCYKKYLLESLKRDPARRFQFVGEYDDDCGGGVRHSAVSCSTAENYTEPTFTMAHCAQGTSFAGMSTLVAKHRPDLIMLQLGVNDVWGGRPIGAILGSYTSLVQQARKVNPRVVLLVAQINKFRPNCSEESATKRAEALVNELPGWAKRLSTPESPVLVADLWTNSDWSKSETNDCVHPNDAGAQRMAANWFKALEKILKVK